MAAATASGTVEPIRVLHVLRAPLGGLFRHVCDLGGGQQGAGLEVGVILGEEPRDPVSLARLDELRKHCALGVHVEPMSRLPGLGDAFNLARITGRIRKLRPHVIHGHGAKGGAYARLLPRLAGGVRVYTPHGGALHFSRTSPQGALFLAMERLMRYRTDGIIFESDFSLRTFIDKVGEPKGPSIVIHNGVTEAEFEPVRAQVGECADFVFIGELRRLKGVGTLIEAASKADTPLFIRIVGSGPDRAAFEEMARAASGHIRVEFAGVMPARQAFALGRVVVMPSHHESLPYVALEAAAAGMPLIATRVGGIPEIFGADANLLVPPADADALAAALVRALGDADGMWRLAERLRNRVQSEFSVSRMVEGAVGFYRQLLDQAPVPHAAGAANGLPGKFHEGVPL